MNQRRWMMCCGLACALAILSGQTLAQPILTPVPLVPSHGQQMLLGAWSHVKYYRGTFSGDIQDSRAGAGVRHFSGSVTLTFLNPHPPTMELQGFGDTTWTAGGTCGTGAGSSETHFLLEVNITAHTYILIGTPPSMYLRGGPPSCPSPQYNLPGPIGQFSVGNALLPAPAAGICGTLTKRSSGPGWTQTDTYTWRFVPVMNNHATIRMYCPTFP